MKDDYIKIRVTKEQKELFKRVAKELNVSMTDLLVVGTENLAKKKEENIKSQKIIEDRAMETEKKLAEITNRIRGNNKKLSKSRRFMFWVW
jgi:uncharacterized protein (DUF1778 family)